MAEDIAPVTDATDYGDTHLADQWRAFCHKLAEAGEILSVPSAPRTPIDQAEGLRYLSRLTATALNMLVESSDPDFPRVFQLVHETAKIGADNPDNYYQQIVVDGKHDYRIWGNRNSVPYLSIGSKANRYATDGTMVGTGEIEFSDLEFGPDGSFEIIASKTEKPGNWLPMAEDTTLLIVRQTFNDKTKEVAAHLDVERISDGPALPPPLTPEKIVSQLMTSAQWVCGTANTFVECSEWFKTEPNRIYTGRDQSAWYRIGGDPKIWYGHIYYELAPDEALVLEVMPPPCRIWNFQLDNWWMESMDYVHRKVWVNNAQAKYEPDGSVVVVCADRDPGFGNWIDLTGHRIGTGLWRWIEAKEFPVPRCKVIKT